MKKIIRIIGIVIVSAVLFCGCSVTSNDTKVQYPWEKGNASDSSGSQSSSRPPYPTSTLTPPTRTPLPNGYETDYDYYVSAYENTANLTGYEIYGSIDMVMSHGSFEMDMPIIFDGKADLTGDMPVVKFRIESCIMGVSDVMDVYSANGLTKVLRRTTANGQSYTAYNENEDDYKNADILRKTDFASMLTEDDISSAIVKTLDGYTEYIISKNDRQVRQFFEVLEELSISASFSDGTSESELESALEGLTLATFDNTVVSVTVSDEGYISAFSLSTGYTKENENGDVSRVKFEIKVNVEKKDLSGIIEPLMYDK